MDDIYQVAKQFISCGEIKNIQAYGNGNINDTYLVDISGGRSEKFVLQRINTKVFPRPTLIINNLRVLTNHVWNRLSSEKIADNRRWEFPTICETVSGEDFHIDSQGGFWRGISYINDASSFDKVLNIGHAFEAGYALGRFQSLAYDLDTNRMHDTLVGFHITPGYLSIFDQVKDRFFTGKRTHNFQYCLDFIEDRRHKVSVLEDAKEDRKISEHIIHGDPKINNFMICNRTGQAVSVVDLDTVKPGLIHYDIGDCLRSACNPLGEETKDFDHVYFDLKLARSILDGYLSVAHPFLSRADFDFLFDAIWLIPFELGLRFFTDELLGNVYFKVNYPTHNFNRALVQFKLTESIEDQIEGILEMISNFTA